MKTKPTLVEEVFQKFNALLLQEKQAFEALWETQFEVAEWQKKGS